MLFSFLILPKDDPNLGLFSTAQEFLCVSLPSLSAKPDTEGERWNALTGDVFIIVKAAPTALTILGMVPYVLQ